MSSPIAIFRAVLTAEQMRSSLVEPLAEKRVEMGTLLFIFVGALPLIAVVVLLWFGPLRRWTPDARRSR